MCEGQKTPMAGYANIAALRCNWERLKSFSVPTCGSRSLGASWQIILSSEGNSKSPVSLSIVKSCKADCSCPPPAFRPPLHVLLMKSLTPIQEIVVFLKHALPCYQKSF